MTDKSGNPLIKWQGLRSDLEVALTPILEQSSAIENEVTIPTNTSTKTIFTIFKPITMFKDQRLIANIDEMRIQRTTQIENELLTITLNGKFNKLTIPDTNKTYGPGEFTIIASKLDAGATDEINTLQLELKKDEPAKQMYALQSIMAQIPALFSHGAEYNINLKMQTPTGDIEYQYDVDLSTLVIRSLTNKKGIATLLNAADAQNEHQTLSMILPFIDELAGHVKLRISKQDLTDWMQFFASDRLEYRSLKHPNHFISAERNQDIQDILLAGIQRGLLSIQEQQYIFDFDFDHGTQFNRTGLFFLANSQ